MNKDSLLQSGYSYLDIKNSLKVHKVEMAIVILESSCLLNVLLSICATYVPAYKSAKCIYKYHIGGKFCWVVLQ